MSDTGFLDKEVRELRDILARTQKENEELKQQLQNGKKETVIGVSNNQLTTTTKMLSALDKKVPREEITGQQVLLRRHTLSEAATQFAVVESERARLRQFLPWVDFTKTIDDELEYLKGCIDKWNGHQEFNFSIFKIEKSGHIYIGNVGACNISWNHHRVEIGYWISKQYEGCGLMKDAVATLEGELFALGFNRIVIKCSTKNFRSATIPLRLGYRLEGILQQEALDLGKYDDTMVFAKLKSYIP